MTGRANIRTRERCDQVYQFFLDYFHKNKLAPSYGDIMSACGLKSRGHLAKIIDMLVREHRLERENGLARGLRLPLASEAGFFNLPLEGTIAADNENPTILFFPPDPNSVVEVPIHLLPPRLDPSGLYVLKVEGDSMRDACIESGDYAIIESCNTCNENDIVVVYLVKEEAATLKKVSPTGRGNAILKPKSHKHQRRIESAGDINVQGRLVAVMRKYE